MPTGPAEILGVLDACCARMVFPALDNGYVVLAATRMSLFCSEADWGLVIETFGFDVRAQEANTAVWSFGSRLVNRNAYEAYVARNPHNELRFCWPISPGPWLTGEEATMYDPRHDLIELRGVAFRVPPVDEWSRHGVELRRSEEPSAGDMCRVVASVARDRVLATEQERRRSMGADMTELLVLDSWHHPDVVSGELPSQSETFAEVARVLAINDCSSLSLPEPPNTHWRNWPLGGTL